jgi:hypothetical protein
MSIAITERSATDTSAVKFIVKIATGLLMVAAASVVLIAVSMMTTPKADSVLQMFLQ